MAAQDPEGAYSELLRDFSSRSDEDLSQRIWLAAAVIAARGGVLTPEIVLTGQATNPTPENWEEMKSEIRRASPPQFLRDD